MAKTAYINARVDKTLKANAEKVLAQVGLSTTDVINLMLHQIVLQQGLPFEARIPNKRTRASMAELDAGKGERFTGSAAELTKYLLAPKPRRK